MCHAALPQGHDYRARMTDHCVRLMINAVNMIVGGTARPKPQNTNLGTRYRLPVKHEKDELRRRLRMRRREIGALPEFARQAQAQRNGE